MAVTSAGNLPPPADKYGRDLGGDLPPSGDKFGRDFGGESPSFPLF